MIRPLLLFLLFVSVIGAETFTTPPGYFPVWVELDGGLAVSRRPEGAPREIDSTATPDGIWSWVIVNETVIQLGQFGAPGNWRLTTAPIDVNGVVQTELVEVPGWKNLGGMQGEMVQHYLDAYKWELIRTAAANDVALPAVVKSALVARAALNRDEARAAGDALKDDLYP